MLPADTWARATQKRVSSTRWGPAFLANSAVTMTRLRSGERSTPVTSPTSTSLYLILVLPASRPSAVLKLIVMTGPRSSTLLTASQPPTSAATSGISHTSCSERGDFGTATASGMSGGSDLYGVSATFVLHGIPDQARVEGHCRSMV